MSRVVVNEVLERALLDEEFRRALETDPNSALRGQDLTDEERDVLLSRDLARMEEFFPGALYCTIRFALINENIVALQPFPDDARKAELHRRGREITATEVNRVDAIKEMLALLR